MSKAVVAKIEELVEPVLAAEGYELVLSEFNPRSHILRLFIDSAKGVTIDDCTSVSRMVSDLLDAEGVSDGIPGSYTLEVSSPGLDRPLVKPCDYQRFAGREVDVTTRRAHEGRRKFSGKLSQASDEAIELVVDGQPHTIDYENIERARLVPEF